MKKQQIIHSGSITVNGKFCLYEILRPEILRDGTTNFSIILDGKLVGLTRKPDGTYISKADKSIVDELVKEMSVVIWRD